MSETLHPTVPAFIDTISQTIKKILNLILFFLTGKNLIMLTVIVSGYHFGAVLRPYDPAIIAWVLGIIIDFSAYQVLQAILYREEIDFPWMIMFSLTCGTIAMSYYFHSRFYRGDSWLGAAPILAIVTLSVVERFKPRLKRNTNEAKQNESGYESEIEANETKSDAIFPFLAAKRSETVTVERSEMVAIAAKKVAPVEYQNTQDIKAESISCSNCGREFRHTNGLNAHRRACREVQE